MTLILDKAPVRRNGAGFRPFVLPRPAERPRRGDWSQKLPRRNASLARALLGSGVATVELLAACVAALATVAFYHVFAYGEAAPTSHNLELCLLSTLLFVVSNVTRGDYRIADYLGLRRQGWRLFGVWTISLLIALAFGFLTKTSENYSRGAVMLFYAAGYVSIYATRLLLVKLARGATRAGGVASRRVFLVGLEDDIESFELRYKPESCGLDVVGAIILRHEDPSTLEEDLVLAAAAARMLRPDDVFILAPWSHTRMIEACVDAFMRVPAQIHLGPEKVLDRFANARIDNHGGISSLSLGGHPLNAVEVMGKRAFDIVASSLALLMLSPVLLATAVAIRLDSKGPVLFVQRRYGFNREPFRIFKFRSMTTMDDGRDIRQATVGDSRITRVGRLIRRYNIDELPQLLNVLKGEMSLVGPRPHALAHDQLFEHKVALYARRHNVKPGITGWAQVNGLRGEIDSPEKIRLRVEHDLHYIDNWSLLLDIWIVFMTVFSKKAYRNAV
jgi:Undecaprenyl-phosphate glucose phosphotransferase